MAIVSLTLSGVAESFTRPVIYDIISQLREMVKIPDTAHIFYPGAMENNPTANSSIHEEHNGKPRFSTDRYLYIDVQETYDVDELGSMATHQYENVVVFVDEDSGVRVWPIYMKTDYIINFRYETVSKTEADRWMADMRIRTTQMRANPMHSIDYHYQVPDPVLELLSTVYEHKKRLVPDIGTYAEYLQRHFTNRLKRIGDLNDSNQRYVIGERQTRIIGIFDTSPLPEKIERSGDSGGWLCTFSYKVSLMRPEGIACQYPLMVYNRLLDDKYIAFKKPQQDPERVAYQTRTASMKAMEMLEADTQLHSTGNIYLPYQIPEYDEFTAKTTPGSYGNALSIMVELDESGSRELFNLRDIHPYEVNPVILDFIATSEWPYMTKTHQSIIGLFLYENYRYRAGGLLTMDADLNISSLIDLQPNKLYHVVLAVCVDLTLLKAEAISRIKKHPSAFVKLVEMVNEGLRDNPDLQVLSRKNFVGPRDFNQFFRFFMPSNARVQQNTRLYRTSPNDPDLLHNRQNRSQKPFVQGPVRDIPEDFIRGDFMGFNTSQIGNIIAMPLRMNEQS